ncbi:MAG: tetratricopeptide repeat protein [Gammaproteobacteria bacterium]
MNSQNLTRKLAAILYADVAGYSRLTGEDEDGTHLLLRDYLDFMSSCIPEHQGTVVHYAGDAVLADFGTVTDALRCATGIQDELQIRNAELPDSRKVQFRIGVNLGEVIQDRGEIYGDGVNVAARLESIADPGGICISDAVRSAAGNKIALDYEFIGEREVKNIAEPVRVYRIRRDEQQTGDTNATPGSNEPVASEFDSDGKRQKPSLVVMPFACMSEDRTLDYLADGLTEDLTTLLARVPGFFVISCGSAFAYKDKRGDTPQLAKDLGVRYVVEGSLRPVGQMVRVSAQLLDATNHAHLWAERFDRSSDQLLELQDEITQAIVARIEPELARAELTRLRRHHPSNMDAWELYQRAHSQLSLKGWSKDTFEESIHLLREAVALDPDFALAHAYLSLLLAISHMFQLSRESPPLDQQAIDEAEKAMGLDSQDSSVLGYVGCALADIGHTSRALELLKQAVEYDPSNAQAWAALGVAQIRSRQVRQGVESLRHGIRISPLDTRLAYWGTILANALFRSGDKKQALVEAQLACRRHDKFSNSRVVLAMILLSENRKQEAIAAIEEAKRLSPDLCSDSIKGLVGRRGAKMLQVAGLLI